jgi:hypothetical protein
MLSNLEECFVLVYDKAFGLFVLRDALRSVAYNLHQQYLVSQTGFRVLDSHKYFFNPNLCFLNDRLDSLIFMLNEVFKVKFIFGPK